MKSEFALFPLISKLCTSSFIPANNYLVLSFEGRLAADTTFIVGESYKSLRYITNEIFIVLKMWDSEDNCKYVTCCRGKRGKRGKQGPPGIEGLQGPPGPQGEPGISDFVGATAIYCDRQVNSLTPAPTSVENVDVALITLGTGAFERNIPNSTVSGGNCRGIYASDLQSIRRLPSQVASGDYSTINGGHSNTASGIYSSVGGGLENTASGLNSSATGGSLNVASGDNSVAIGGSSNTVSGQSSSIIGGSGNMTTTTDCFMAGGSGNIISAGISAIIGGTGNSIPQTHTGSIILGGQGNTAPFTDSIVGGSYNDYTDFPGSNGVFTIGGGTSTSSQNLFVVTAVTGDVYTKGSINPKGADYAEYFESFDGNAIVEGTTVVFVEGTIKIRPASADEVPFGVVSSSSCLIGKGYEKPVNRYLRNEDGSIVLEEQEIEIVTAVTSDVEQEVIVEEINHSLNPPVITRKAVKKVAKVPQMVEAIVVDENGKEIGKRIIQKIETKKVKINRRKANPKYMASSDNSDKYNDRRWNVVGLLGVVRILKDSPVDPDWKFIKDEDDYELWLIR